MKNIKMGLLTFLIIFSQTTFASHKKIDCTQLFAMFNQAKDQIEKHYKIRSRETHNAINEGVVGIMPKSHVEPSCNYTVFNRCNEEWSEKPENKNHTVSLRSWSAIEVQSCSYSDDYLIEIKIEARRKQPHKYEIEENLAIAQKQKELVQQQQQAIIAQLKQELLQAQKVHEQDQLTLQKNPKLIAALAQKDAADAAQREIAALEVRNKIDQDEARKALIKNNELLQKIYNLQVKQNEITQQHYELNQKIKRNVDDLD